MTLVRAVYGGLKLYEEQYDAPSPTLTANRDTRSITRTLIIHEVEGPLDSSGNATGFGFSAINAFIAECLPINAPPGRYPVENSQFFVSDLEVHPFSGAKAGNYEGDLTAHPQWQAMITYSPLPFTPPEPDDPQPTDNLEINIGGGGEFMTLPGGDLFFEDETNPIGNESPVARRIAITNYSITKHHVVGEQIPYTALKAAAGTVNQTAFPRNHPVFPGVAAETLLFESYGINYRYTSDGSRDYRISYNFRERVGTDAILQTPEEIAAEDPVEYIIITWNHIWDSTTKTFKKIFTDKEHTKTIYSRLPTTAFDALFDVETAE